MRNEIRHHTDEQIRDALAFGRDVVDELDMPADLREQAFTLAVNLRAAKAITEVMPPPIGVPAMAMPQGR